MPEERQCIGCGDTDENSRLERCVVCGKSFCADCAYKATGRRFCNPNCAREYYYGETDDDEDDALADE